MSSAITKIAATTAMTLVAGLGLTTFATSATAAGDDVCGGVSAPANNHPGNQAPVLGNDSVDVLAGAVSTLQVLTNDSDPDGDKLYLESASSPRRGELCVRPDGTILFAADVSRTAYTTSFRYGVTDGDRYRSATVTVNVQGLQPMRPVLEKRLVLGKHSHRIRQRAVVSFTNPNPKRMLLLAGSPRRKRPTVQRYVYPGRTFTLRTREPHVAYLTVLAPKTDDAFVFVNNGVLNTRNGHLQGSYIGQSFARPVTPRATHGLWARR